VRKKSKKKLRKEFPVNRIRIWQLSVAEESQVPLQVQRLERP
jgi:hypothetical protein